eukprot:CAMPEP_0201284354 /NCGR_PEP_ID=MMETSP1317-20130820/71260_1 /ASSEMBLY_ACC=CAM_ASM_000770 /TAXON_ID=187299 /ORGANISM="Undescribed Undescribed, Strain Undescribed" /LENGTH=51 /DNA_ID=CAMNT_0047604185 /DNA_START=105 /DNA_END=260 /DNA_ORIENTATION=-
MGRRHQEGQSPSATGDIRRSPHAAWLPGPCDRGPRGQDAAYSDGGTQRYFA